MPVSISTIRPATQNDAPPYEYLVPGAYSRGAFRISGTASLRLKSKLRIGRVMSGAALFPKIPDVCDISWLMVEGAGNSEKYFETRSSRESLPRSTMIMIADAANGLDEEASIKMSSTR